MKYICIVFIICSSLVCSSGDEIPPVKISCEKGTQAGGGSSDTEGISATNCIDGSVKGKVVHVYWSNDCNTDNFPPAEWDATGVSQMSTQLSAGNCLKNQVNPCFNAEISVWLDTDADITETADKEFSQACAYIDMNANGKVDTGEPVSSTIGNLDSAEVIISTGS